MYNVLSISAVQQRDPAIYMYVCVCVCGWVYTYIYVLFLTFSSIMFHHKWLGIVPCAIQQGLIAYPSIYSLW